MTARVLDRKSLIARLEWQMKVAAERTSNYDGRVTVNAADLCRLIAEARCAVAERDDTDIADAKAWNAAKASAWAEGAMWAGVELGMHPKGARWLVVADNPYRTKAAK